MWFPRFRQAYAALALPWLLSILVQTAGRLHLLLVYSPPGSLKALAPDIGRMLFVGGLFDIRSASILLTPCVLLAGLLAASERGYALWRRTWPWLATTLCTVVFALTAANFFYYATYDRSIDVFIFGLAEDDTAAIMRTLWHDYPVVRGILSLILFAVAACWLFRRWQRWLDTWPLRRVAISALPTALVVTLALLAVFAIGVRGSLGTFPLRQNDTQVSEVKMLNMLTPNGLMALHWAFQAHRDHGHFPDASNSAGAALFSRFLGHATAAPPSLKAFEARTAVNPAVEARPPNVVLTVMESMGHHLGTLDRPGQDLLGALRPHWQSDWLFERFISEGDGTIDSLSRLFVRSPMSGIGQTTAQATDFSSNMIKPYLARGYKVVYVTSGSGAWRNLNQFLPRLGVSEFMEQSGLKRLYPEAPQGTWGMPDEYMFRYIETRLMQAEQEGKPVLIISLSTTHHPPYQTPAGYSRASYDLSDAERARLAHFGENQDLNEVLNTLRYANDQLGRFISRVKAQAPGRHTIIAVTGDHNVRGIGYPNPGELALGHAVPLYLYVPPAYRGTSHFDPARVGSHKDIWPTLYSLSLSDTPYYRTGCDMLAERPDPLWCGGYNPEVVITHEGAYTLGNPAEFRPWAETTGLMLGERQAMTPEQQAWQTRWGAYTDLLQWQINRQVHKQL